MADKKANEIHSLGFNCAQSVLSVLSDVTGLDEKTSLAITGGFGGGIRAAEVCGAVSGAIMALGLCFPYNDSGDNAAKDRIAALTREFHSRFKEENGSMICRELLGYDMETPEGMTAVKEKDLTHTLCPGFMDCAEKIVRAIIVKHI
jgi:C_GCAxxG_C_C family probable redox protein